MASSIESGLASPKMNGNKPLPVSLISGSGNPDEVGTVLMGHRKLISYISWHFVDERGIITEFLVLPHLLFLLRASSSEDMSTSLEFIL